MKLSLEARANPCEISSHWPNYTLSENIVQMSFLPKTFFCRYLECSNLDMLLVMNLHIFVYIQTHLSCFSIELWNIYWKWLSENIMQMFTLSAKIGIVDVCRIMKWCIITMNVYITQRDTNNTTTNIFMHACLCLT